MFVAIYEGVIIPWFLRWCEVVQGFVHSILFYLLLCAALV